MKIGPWVARKRKAFWEARFAVAVANCNASMISRSQHITDCLALEILGDRSRNSGLAYKGSRADVGADVGLVPGRRGCGRGFQGVWVGAIGVGQRPVGRASPGFDSHAAPVSPFCFVERWRFGPVSGANEARSDHDVQAVPAIQCVTSMVREQRYPM